MSPRGTAPQSAENAGMPRATPASASPRPTRDRAATEGAILAAVGQVLARDGFAAVGVNAIAKEAGVDKVLIYRYFGGLPELLRAWGHSGNFWPDAQELMGQDPKAFLALPAADRYARFIEHFIDSLRARPLTIEILAAEVAERNELTVILESQREAWGESVSRLLLGDEAFQSRPELQALTVLWIAGVQHLLVRSRSISIFGGIDIRSDAGWQTIKAAARKMAAQLFADEAPATPG
jgi:AcrR family transcriptional regulator